MAKSPIRNIPRKSKSVSSSKMVIEDPNLKLVTELDLSFILLGRGSGADCKYNLKDWLYLECDVQNELAKPNRSNKMLNLYKWVNKLRIEKYSDATINYKLVNFKSYICFCDKQGVDPFSKVGYLSYMGNDGELRRQVSLAISKNKFYFQYEHGEEFGITERSAADIKCTVDFVLRALNVYFEKIQINLHKFYSRSEDSTKPYDPKEWEVALRRLNFYFTSLATQLISFRNEHPTKSLPVYLNVDVDCINGEYVSILCGGNNKGTGHVGYSSISPFSQCMAAGYFLFAYYTAFNTSSILDVSHPIKSIKLDKEGRTSKFVQIRAYKARAAKEVEALFHSNEYEREHAGVILASLSKRDRNGIQNGLTFIRVMSLFSKVFSSEKYGRLFYELDKQHNHTRLNINDAAHYISINLGLYNVEREQLTDHFIEQFKSVVEKGVLFQYTAITSPTTGFRVMRRGQRKLTRSKVYLIKLAYAVLTCLTDVQIDSIIMPLYYSEKDEDGNINVSFNFDDGGKGCFNVPAKYKAFIKRLEEYSNIYNPIPTLNGSELNGQKYPYLLPLGCRLNTYKCEKIKGLISMDMLHECGIRSFNFYLGLTASRIRKTTSHLEYMEKDKGFAARMILQHSIETQSKAYGDGHPTENKKIISQSMQVLVEISQGTSRDYAINNVKQHLNIPVLSYEKYKERNMPTNPNGVSCDGKPDFIGGTKNLHYPARKFAQNNNIINHAGDIPCYQYDLCMFCKNAQLVDDPYVVYKLLSFIDALSDSIDYFPERKDITIRKIKQFQSHIVHLPLSTIDAAQELMLENGRYFMFTSKDAVMQYL